MPEESHKFLFHPQQELCGERIDKALSTHKLVRTRSRAAKLIQMGRVLKMGRAVKPSYLIEVGDEFEIDLPEEVERGLTPFDAPLEIHFEDEDLLVLNKPSGWVVHPSYGHENKTLVNALVYHCAQLSMGFSEHRPGIVHRLDKDTSGLMVVAKNDFTHFHLAEQFKKKSVTRLYKALCYGLPSFHEKRTESYLIRHPVYRKKFCSHKSQQGLSISVNSPRGKWACTRLSFVNSFKGQISLLHCKLETGRTHQIRVHVSELGHPIINDPIYSTSKFKNGLKSSELRDLLKKTQRLGLHASVLGFSHPRTLQHMEFHKEWPEDLLELVRYCGFTS